MSEQHSRIKGWEEPTYESVKSWRRPEADHFYIIAGMIKGALLDFGKFVADREPGLDMDEVLQYLDEWGNERRIPINKGDTRFWGDVVGAPREYPPYTDVGAAMPPTGEDVIATRGPVGPIGSDVVTEPLNRPQEPESSPLEPEPHHARRQPQPPPRPQRR